MDLNSPGIIKVLIFQYHNLMGFYPLAQLAVSVHVSDFAKMRGIDDERVNYNLGRSVRSAQPSL